MANTSTDIYNIWGWVKTLVPLDVHPTKKLSIGIDPYPYSYYCTMVNKPTSKTGGHLLGRLVGQNRD
jgi:hypothetical protein